MLPCNPILLFLLNAASVIVSKSGREKSNGSYCFTRNLRPANIWELNSARLPLLMKFYFPVNTDLTQGCTHSSIHIQYTTVLLKRVRDTCFLFKVT